MKQVIIAILLLFAMSCQPKLEREGRSYQKISQLNWVIGNWVNDSGENKYYESWEKLNDSTYTGNSFMVNAKDTLFSEKILIVQKDTNLFYIPTVSNQNDRKPIIFKLISTENNEFIFENKLHDFPQRIIYSNPQPDSLLARIEGLQDGQFRKEDFKMVRNK